MSETAAKPAFKKDWSTKVKDIDISDAYWTKIADPVEQAKSKPDPEKMNPKVRAEYDRLVEAGFGNKVETYNNSKTNEPELRISGMVTQVTQAGKEHKTVFDSYNAGDQKFASDLLDKFGPGKERTEGVFRVSSTPGREKADGSGRHQNRLKVAFSSTMEEHQKWLDSRPAQAEKGAAATPGAAKPAPAKGGKGDLDDEIPF